MLAHRRRASARATDRAEPRDDARACRPRRRAARARRARPRARPASIGRRGARAGSSGARSAPTSSPSPRAPRAASRRAASRRTRSRCRARAPCRRAGSCCCARSTILTGSPMSSTKTSPRPPIAPAWTTSDDRLRDRHEVARHLRVRDGHRPAALDLAAEDRDHAARRAEHVAEAHGDEARRRRRRAAPYASTIHSQSAFDWPITVFGLTALSVETSTKRSTPNSTATSAIDLRRERRCCAPPRAGSPPSAARACTRPRGRRPPGGSARRPGASSSRLPTSASTGTHGGEAALVDELALDLEQRRLALVDEDQPLAADARDLAAELGADRAAGAGDEHGLRRRGTTRPRRGRPRPARGRARPRPAPGGSGRRGRGRRRSARAGPAASSPGRPRSRATSTIRWRISPEADGIAISTSSGLVARARMLRQLVGRAEHADAVDAQVLLARVVVDEADRRVAERRAASASP